MNFKWFLTKIFLAICNAVVAAIGVALAIFFIGLIVFAIMLFIDNNCTVFESGKMICTFF